MDLRLKTFVLLSTFAIAFGLALGVGFAEWRNEPPLPPATATPQPPATAWTIVAAGRHAWPSLDDAEKADLVTALKLIGLKVKIDIVCNDAGCGELAADLDDACEDAGLDSTLDKAIGPLGYGIGVQANEFDKPAAEALIEAVTTASQRRLAPTLAPGTSPPGVVTLLIGKKPR